LEFYVLMTPSEVMVNIDTLKLELLWCPWSRSWKAYSVRATSEPIQIQVSDFRREINNKSSLMSQLAEQEMTRVLLSRE
jgi:hypothetical protein